MKKLILVSVCLLLAGCADGVSLYRAAGMEQVGFLHGFWHGLIILFSFIGSLFSDDIAVYATYNTGGWYDFGFLMGIGAFSGGSSTRARR